MSDSTRQEVIQETIRNAKKDRERILGHISRISLSIGVEKGEGEEKDITMSVANFYKEVGGTLVKLMEGLQRSNEQMIKVAGVMQKETKIDPPKEDEDFDPDEVYNTLEEEEEEEEEEDGEDSTDIGRG